MPRSDNNNDKANGSSHVASPVAFITNDSEVPIGVMVGVDQKQSSHGPKKQKSPNKSVRENDDNRSPTTSKAHGKQSKEKPPSPSKNSSEKHQIVNEQDFAKVASGAITEGTGNSVVIRRGGETGSGNSRYDDIHLTATNNAVNDAIRMVGLKIAGGKDSHVIIHRSPELNVCYTRKDKWTKADRQSYLEKWRKFRHGKKGGCCGCCGGSKRRSHKVQHSDYDSD
jgi:hypothetical protein